MKKYLLLLILLFGLQISNAQTKLINKAEKEYDQQAYASVNSGNLYEILVDKEFSSSAVYAKLGDSYYFNGDYKNALKAYNQIQKLKDNYSFTTDQLFRFAQSLKSNGQYSEAAKVIKELNKISGKEQINSGTDYLKDITKQSDRYVIKLVTANSKMPDYGTAFYKEKQVIFTSARDTNVSKKYRDAWTGKPYYKLYEATITEDGDLINPKKLAGKINSVFHQSTPVITNDGNQMYFTRSNFLGNKLGVDDSKTNRLKIYRATLVNGNWDKIEDLSINDNSYSNAHPALRPDGKSLIFASDRPGSLGQTDLYEVEIKNNGTLGEPKNMGTAVNTIGRETFPFVTKSGMLYFSSDGQSGLGGLDVFAAIEDNNTYKIVNLGAPVNSGNDDFAFVINSDTKKGFVSSNRTNDDQIYSLTELAPLKEIAHELMVLGKVYDDKTGDFLPKVKITVYDKNNQKIDEFSTDNAGEYIVKVPAGDYTLLYEKSGYLLKDEYISVRKGENTTIILDKHLTVDPNAKQFISEENKLVDENDDLTEALDLKPIYFDLNGSRIKKASLKELDKVIQLLKDYPQMTVDVKSHTDSQGDSEYNMKLSERRANATMYYLLKKGIKPNRVTGRGYGESQIINKCTDGVKCSDNEHELNRRSEFIISLNNNNK